MLSRTVSSLALLAAGVSGLSFFEKPPSSAITADMSPVRKVITLIEEMKVQVEKDAADDLTTYDKLMCWCETNDKAKTEAIETAEASIAELGAFLEEATAKEAELKTQIEALAGEIASDEDALATATATREKDYAAFTATEADMKETISLLGEAVAVLEKVQLLQKEGKAGKAQQSQVHTLLLQLQDKVKSRPISARFAGLMQKDLFDVLGAFSVDTSSNRSPRLRHGASAAQVGSQLLPWEKSEEQIGMEAKPNDLSGAAANAKSYNSRSGSILGLLSEMMDEFKADLSAAQKEDFTSEVNFQNLKAAKLGEIKAGTEAKEQKEADLADTLDKAAKAKKDQEATTAAMEADEDFVGTMKKDCAAEDEQYKSRVAVRTEELQALGETLKILSEDDARDLFNSTVTLLQISNEKGASAELSAAQERATERAMKRLATVAKKNGSWALAALAVRMRLDAFSKVKEAMDKMFAELSKQQKEEYEKKEACTKEIDLTEDEYKVASNTKEDLEHKLQSLINELETLAKDIEALKAEEGELEVSLKEAGEQRKSENEVYQQSVTDQRATINILNKALKRLQMFYTPKLAEIQAHSQEQKPGEAVSERPTSGKDYSKSAGAGGVLQLLAKIISNAESAEAELEKDEQHSQALYSELVTSTKATIEANRAAQAEKMELSAETAAAKSETEGALLATNQDLEKLGELLAAHHMDCDWLLKYFDLRQQARAEEMDAITDAKAVLSGSDFGK
mmetsp:Transcript_73076/g.152561  ORF Transcript_73076/g.152561 Transcript_73076/m.152561 type:complete len:741 (-) Transcript_73076:39-2261(-)